MEEGVARLSHLYMTYFLGLFSATMVLPVIADVTVSALCPGQDQCSLAIYLSGIQQVIVGLGSLVMMPLIGNLSDKHGRKALLTIPLVFAVLPLAILAYSRSRNFFYIYYVLRTLISMFCEGSVHFLALAYAADNVPAGRRASAFGILSGIGSAAFVCGNLSARFLSTPSTFQVATAVGVAALAYMAFFLPDSVGGGGDHPLTAPIVSKEGKLDGACPGGESADKARAFKKAASLGDTVSLLRSSLTFLQAAIVAFFGNLADVGLHASMMYYLKAQFHFNKNQFADLMVIAGIAGTISQLLIMPLLAPVIGEARLLSIGLFFNCTHMILYSVAWASWVPYAAAMFSVLFVFTQPCMRTIVSKQVGSCEQGKAQGCISGICQLANVVSPLVFSPLTALFLSDRAPFHFPGFSIMCIGFASMIAFVQSVMMRMAPPISDGRVSNCHLLA